ncbi:MAG: hypothetical protein H7244_01750 [Herminiimonas sp.]|nr:hypothetical protein [Herminiimonas sp.]
MRLKLTRHAIAALILSMRSSAEILMLVFGPALIGLIAVIALPPLYASSRPFPEASMLILMHAFLMAAPLWMLRGRLLPPAVVAWLRMMPISLGLQIRTDLAVAGAFMLPLAGAYLASALVWIYNAPAWLHPLPATAALLSSVSITWWLAAGILTLRARWRPRPTRRIREPEASALRHIYAPPRNETGFWYRRLFWLPFVRNENHLARQQLLLTATAGVAAIACFQPALHAVRGVCGLFTSGLMIIMTDRADKAVRAQIAYLRMVTRSWPLPLRHVETLARCISAVPALCVAGLLVTQASIYGTVRGIPGIVYLGVLTFSIALLIGVPTFTPRGRVGWIVLSSVLLTAIGSEALK